MSEDVDGFWSDLWNYSPLGATLNATGVTSGISNALPAAANDIHDLLYNAATGHLDTNQVAQINATTDTAITHAAAGNAPLAQSEMTGWTSDLNSVLRQANAAPISSSTWWEIAVLVGIGAIVLIKLLD